MKPKLCKHCEYTEFDDVSLKLCIEYGEYDWPYFICKKCGCRYADGSPGGTNKDYIECVELRDAAVLLNKQKVDKNTKIIDGIAVVPVYARSVDSYRLWFADIWNERHMPGNRPFADLHKNIHGNWECKCLLKERHEIGNLSLENSTVLVKKLFLSSLNEIYRWSIE